MAKRAFDHCAEDYDRYRPGYPQELVAWIAQTAPPGWIADVGAGSGIFTRALSNAGRDVIAVEPSPSMLARIDASSSSSTINRIAATAEQTALRSTSMSAVTCAQAFHWFNPPFALAEFARILQPGGLLLLVWNNRDRGNPFVAAFESLIAAYNPAYRREYREQDWSAKIAACNRFSPAERLSYRHTWRMGRADFVGFTRSVSYIRNVLSADARAEFESKLMALMDDHFASDRCPIPLETHAWWASRLS